MSTKLFQKFLFLFESNYSISICSLGEFGNFYVIFFVCHLDYFSATIFINWHARQDHIATLSFYLDRFSQKTRFDWLMVQSRMYQFEKPKIKPIWIVKSVVWTIVFVENALDLNPVDWLVTLCPVFVHAWSSCQKITAGLKWNFNKRRDDFQFGWLNTTPLREEFENSFLPL